MFGAPRVEKHLMHKIILIEQNGIIIVVNTTAMRMRERERIGMQKSGIVLNVI